MTRPTIDWVVVGLLGIGAIFLFANLNSGYLWEDEAETGVLAKNTLQFGYPRACDGRNCIDIAPSIGYGPGEAWIYSPWLSLYLLAGVFAVAGDATWIARWPFAVLGWLSIFLTWRLARRLTDDRRIQRISVALLTCSVPFLLHMRQCRYYSLTTALVVSVCLAYLAFLRQTTMKRSLLLGVVLILLFHSNFGMFLPTVGAIGLHQLGWGDRSVWRRLAGGAGLVAVFTVPWAVFFYRSGFIETISLERMANHLEYYVRITNKFFIPLAVMALTGGVWWWSARRHRTSRLSGGASARWFFVLLGGATLAFLLIPDQRHMRYLIPMLPLLLISESWWLAAWIRRRRTIGWAVTLLALFTNVLQSPHVRIPLADFVYELTHTYRGPMEGVVAYLREHGRPEDVVKTPYDDRTLMFYTNLTIEHPSQFLQETDPDWIVIRRDWIPKEFFDSPYFHRITTTYERIELDAPDIQWQNREDPGSHHFRTVQNAPRVVIYRKLAIAGRGRLG